MPNLLAALFGCAHANLSRVWSLRDRYGNPEPPYVVCLHCGKEFAYDLATMRIAGERTERRVERRAVETVEVEA